MDRFTHVSYLPIHAYALLIQLQIRFRIWSWWQLWCRDMNSLCPNSLDADAYIDVDIVNLVNRDIDRDTD